MIDGAHAAREGIVPTGIENDDVESVARVAHLLDDPIRADGFYFDVAFALDLRRGGDQVVASIELHTMTGVIEQADGRRSGLLQAGSEFLNGPFHRVLVCVAARNSFESDTVPGL